MFKKYLLSSAIICSVFSPNSHASFESNEAVAAAGQAMMARAFLDPRDRPQAIKERIEKSFAYISNKEGSGWTFNGEPKYDMLGIDDHELVKTILREAPKEQKEFWFMDIGAADFSWGRALSQFLNDNPDISAGKVVNIIGVRGERVADLAKNPEVQKIDGINLYEFGGFKIEDMSQDLAKRGLDLSNKINFAVSRWTKRHLNDPVGMLADTFNLLSPEGLLLADGFFFLNEAQPIAEELSHKDVPFGPTFNSELFNKNMHQLLHAIGAPYLIQPYKEKCSLNRFVLKKPDNKHYQIPMTYLGIENFEAQGLNGSKSIVRFKRHVKDAELYLTENEYTFHGDKRLFDWFNDRDLLKYDPNDLGPRKLNIIKWESAEGEFEWFRDPEYSLILQRMSDENLAELGMGVI